jgi:hypothetical protein
MNKSSITLTTIAALATPMTAMAHGGMHEFGHMLEGLQHLLSSPYHLLGIGAAGVAIALIVARTRKAKARQRSE